MQGNATPEADIEYDARVDLERWRIWYVVDDEANLLSTEPLDLLTAIRWMRKTPDGFMCPSTMTAPGANVASVQSMRQLVGDK